MHKRFNVLFYFMILSNDGLHYFIDSVSLRTTKWICANTEIIILKETI